MGWVLLSVGMLLSCKTQEEVVEYSQHFEPVMIDTIFADPKDYPYPNIAFEYAVSYIYNVGGNAPKELYEPINGKNGIARSARKMKRLEQEDLDTLNTLFAPIEVRVMGNSIIMPTSYCYIPRDAIVFYDSDDEIVATMEVCFECMKVVTSNGMEFPQTGANWGNLNAFFHLQLGHPKH